MIVTCMCVWEALSCCCEFRKKGLAGNEITVKWVGETTKRKNNDVIHKYTKVSRSHSSPDKIEVKSVLVLGHWRLSFWALYLKPP